MSPELLLELEQHKESLSRRALARLVCQRLDWKNSNDQFQLMGARKVLSTLHQRGVLQLPASTFQWPARRVVEKLPPPSQPICQALDQVGPVELIRVGNRRSHNAQLWRQAMAHHYLGEGPLCGSQLRYLIQSPKGCLGALAFSAPALKVRPRDELIGWAEEVRRHRLHRIVNNSRFLILPWVHIPNLASHVLALAVKGLPGDWQTRYGVHPVLLETFVDKQRFQGTCYEAAGWQRVGETTGRGRQDPTHQRKASIKSIWIKPLHPQWKELLQAPPETLYLAPLRPPRTPPMPPSIPVDWAESEMRAADLGDARLTRRLIRITRDFSARPTAHIPEACGSRAHTKAAYRFFDQKAVTLQTILASHRQETLKRARAHPVVLAVQDTTELDYTAHPETTGLGPIGNHRPHVQGLELHPTVVFTPSGTPLGLWDVQCWARDPDHKIKFRKPVEQKESVKWLHSVTATAEARKRSPDTRWVNIADSEADMYEYMAQAERSDVRCLVRCHRDRHIVESDLELWEYMRSLPVAGSVAFEIPRRANRRARQAQLTVSFRLITLKPPDYLKGQPNLALWGILLQEQNPPQGEQPIQWRLMTNQPVETLDEAVEKARWYGRRFQIEAYFRTLKSGCRMEDRQLGQRRRLENCLAIDLIVAWRIVHLQHQSREVPDAPCTGCFDEKQQEVLSAIVQARGGDNHLPTLREAILLIALLGGFLGRASDGKPGAQTLWRGLQRFDGMVEGYWLARATAIRPVPRTTDYG